MLYDLQFFSGNGDHPEQPDEQSTFLFRIVFGVTLIHFFQSEDQCRTRQAYIIKGSVERS